MKKTSTPAGYYIAILGLALLLFASSIFLPTEIGSITQNVGIGTLSSVIVALLVDLGNTTAQDKKNRRGFNRAIHNMKEACRKATIELRIQYQYRVTVEQNHLREAGEPWRPVYEIMQERTNLSNVKKLLFNLDDYLEEEDKYNLYLRTIAKFVSLCIEIGKQADFLLMNMQLCYENSFFNERFYSQIKEIKDTSEQIRDKYNTQRRTSFSDIVRAKQFIEKINETCPKKQLVICDPTSGETIKGWELDFSGFDDSIEIQYQGAEQLLDNETEVVEYIYQILLWSLNLFPELKNESKFETDGCKDILPF